MKSRFKTVVLGAIAAITGAVIFVIAKPNPAPSNSAAPGITGTDQVSVGTLTASTGTWTGSPTSFTYQWQRADDALFTINVTNIGTNLSTYSLVLADDAKYHRVIVGATNAGGTTNATSGVIGPTASSGASPVSNLWVDDTGGSSACVRSVSQITYAVAQSSNNVCDKLSVAYGKVQQCADKIIWKGGSYVSDQINRNTALGSICSANTVLSVAAGETVAINGGLRFGLHAGSVAPPNHVTVDGCAPGALLDIHTADTGTSSGVNGGVTFAYNATTSTPASDDTLSCARIDVGDRLDTGYPIDIDGALRITLDRVMAGPVCCGSVTTGSAPPCNPARYSVAGACSPNSPVGIRVATTSSSLPVADGLTVKDSSIRWILRSCSTWPTATYGACPGGEVVNGQMITQGTACPVITVASGSTDSCHVDGSQMYSGKNLTFVRNQILNVEVQGLFLEHTNCVNPCWSGTNLITDNFFAVTGGSCGFCVSSNAAGSTAGDWTIARNTTNVHIRFAGFSLVSGTVIRMYGNIGTIANSTTSTGNGLSCNPGAGVTWVYEYNKENVGGATGCGSTDSTFSGLSSLVIDATVGANTLPNFHLPSNSSLKDTIPASWPFCTDFDVDVQARPVGSACEPGGDDVF